MAKCLKALSNKDAIYKRTLYLVQDGETLKKACEIVAGEVKKSEASVCKHFCCSGGNPDKQHSLHKLTLEEENILTGIITVYSICHEALTVADVIAEVDLQFNVAVTKTWVKNFLQQHHNAIRARKTKLLAKKRIDPHMADQIADFCAQVETVSEFHPIQAGNVVNYNEMRVWLSPEGVI